MEKKKGNKYLIIIIIYVVFFGTFLVVEYINDFSLIENIIYNNNSKGGILEGISYRLPYDKKWKISEDNYVYKGSSLVKTKGLSYKNYGALIELAEVDYDSIINCNFNYEYCRRNVYNQMYNSWKNNTYDYEVVKGNDLIYTLKGNIQYFYFYLKKDGINVGKYIFMVSYDRNFVLTLEYVLVSHYDKFSEFDTAAMDLLSNIEIDGYKRELNNNDDEESMWNRYSYIQNEASGIYKVLNGNWLLLDSSENNYLVLDGNSFNWYKSKDNLLDNYYSGTIEIYTGKEGFNKVNLEEERFDYLINYSYGRIKEEDIYSIIFKPSHYVSNGELIDTSNEYWNYVIILVDHGIEGIEAQVMDLDNKNAYYYIKYSD